MILVIGGCGYVGSALCQHLSRADMPWDSVDLEMFGNAGMSNNMKIDYRSLTAMDLAKYSHIVVLAAHSSVKMALADPAAAFYNNVLGFKQLLEKITPRQRIIYASSSSVYNGVAGASVDEEWPNFTLGNMYDFSKYSNDCFASYSGCDYISLRFGTVNGPSPNMRTDLMVNRMVLTALKNGKVCVANPKVHRPILVLSDLVRAIAAIIRETPPSGIYNLASFNGTVEEIGRYIAERLDVPVEAMPDSPTYDFSIKSDKLTRETGYRFSGSLASVVDELVSHYLGGDYSGGDR